MSGQTWAWRRRYSSSRSGRTWSVKQTRRTPIPLTGLEVELVDVVGLERVRVAQQHGAVLADGEVAELAGGELVALLALDEAGGERGARVGGEVAQVGRVPQRERLDRAVLDVGLHLVRGAEAGELHLALVG